METVCFFKSLNNCPFFSVRDPLACCRASERRERGYRWGYRWGCCWGYAGAAALLLPAGGVWSRRPQSTLSTAVSRLSVSRRDRFHLSPVNPLQCDEPRLQRSWLTYGFRWPPWWSRPCSTGAATVGTFSAFCCCSLTRTCCHLPGVGDELAANWS